MRETACFLEVKKNNDAQLAFRVGILVDIELGEFSASSMLPYDVVTEFNERTEGYETERHGKGITDSFVVISQTKGVKEKEDKGMVGDGTASHPPIAKCVPPSPEDGIWQRNSLIK